MMQMDELGWRLSHTVVIVTQIALFIFSYTYTLTLPQGRTIFDLPWVGGYRARLLDILV